MTSEAPAFKKKFVLVFGGGITVSALRAFQYNDGSISGFGHYFPPTCRKMRFKPDTP
jgi:hypothetical protein